jgi:hypothetical protein
LARGLARPGRTLSEGACLFVLERSRDADKRGVTPLAVVTRWSHQPGSGITPPDPTRTIVSAAGLRLAGAVCIEHWAGYCFAAAGAAAVAAATAAAQGRHLPVADPADASRVSVAPVAIDALPVSEGTLPATVVADADGAHHTILEISVPVVS